MPNYLEKQENCRFEEGCSFRFVCLEHRFCCPLIICHCLRFFFIVFLNDVFSISCVNLLCFKILVQVKKFKDQKKIEDKTVGDICLYVY